MHARILTRATVFNTRTVSKRESPSPAPDKPFEDEGEEEVLARDEDGDLSNAVSGKKSRQELHDEVEGKDQSRDVLEGEQTSTYSMSEGEVKVVKTRNNINEIANENNGKGRSEGGCKRGEEEEGSEEREMENEEKENASHVETQMRDEERKEGRDDKEEEGAEEEEVEDIRTALTSELMSRQRLIYYECDENPLRACMEQFQLPVIAEEEEEEAEEEEEGKVKEGNRAKETNNENEVEGSENVSEPSAVPTDAVADENSSEIGTSLITTADEEESGFNSAVDADVECSKDSASVEGPSATVEADAEGRGVISPSSTEHSLLFFVTESFLEVEKEDGAKEGKDADKSKAPDIEPSSEKTASISSGKAPLCSGKAPSVAGKRVSFNGTVYAKSDQVVERKKPSTSTMPASSRKSVSASNASSTSTSSTSSSVMNRNRRLAPAKSEPLRATSFKTPQKPSFSKPQQLPNQQRQQSPASSLKLQRQQQQPQQQQRRSKSPRLKEGGQVEKSKVGDSAEDKTATRAATPRVDG